MNETRKNRQAEPSFTHTNLGHFSNLGEHTFAPDGLPFSIDGKVFLNERLGLTSAEVSLNKLDIGAEMPFYHKHKHSEEIYVFIKGKGEFQVDGQIFPVQEGSVIRVAPEGVRCWRNTGSEALYFIVIQAAVNSYRHGTTIEDGEMVNQDVKWA